MAAQEVDLVVAVASVAASAFDADFILPAYLEGQTMALHSMKIIHLSGAVLLLGAIAPQSFAQNAAIIPAGQVPGAAVPAPVAAPLVVARPMTDVQFKDIAVADVLSMIAENFNVPIVIAEDVRGIILPVINLPNKTPEVAIQTIAKAAGLKYRKEADGTFLIAKNLGDDLGSTSAITSPNGSSAAGNPFGTGVFSLPPISGATGDSDAQSGAFEIPTLVGDGTSSTRKRRQFIRVRNVAPSMMAYWIDPAHNEMPVQFQGSIDSKKRYGPQTLTQNAFNGTDQISGQSNSGAMPVSPFTAGSINPYTQQRGNAEMRSNAQFGGGGNNQNGNRGGNNQNGNNRGGANGGGGGAGGVFDLPEGVDQVVAIDPQNALLVFGTDEGVRELQDTINFLDRPLKQVEIEAQFVSVNTGSTNSFGINYSTAQGNFSANASGFAPTPPIGSNAFQVGVVRGNFQATLTSLISNNRAKLITAPRILAINNLTASLFTTQSTPVILNTVSQNIGGQQAVGQNLIFISTSIGLTVTPTINNDDTITVLMQPELGTQTGGSGGVPGVLNQRLETIANVHDGDTIALGGLKSSNVSRNTGKIPVLSNIPLIGGLFRSRSDITLDNDLIIFLTARIVRRLGDDDVVPGT